MYVNSWSWLHMQHLGGDAVGGGSCFLGGGMFYVVAVCLVVAKWQCLGGKMARVDSPHFATSWVRSRAPWALIHVATRLDLDVSSMPLWYLISKVWLCIRGMYLNKPISNLEVYCHVVTGRRIIQITVYLYWHNNKAAQDIRTSLILSKVKQYN